MSTSPSSAADEVGTLPRDKGAFGRILAVLSWADRRETTLVVALLVASGVAEAVGIISLLPLLSLAVGESGAGGLSEMVLDLIRSVGIDPGVGTLVILIVGGLSLKAILFLLAMRQAGSAGANLATRLRLHLIRSLMTARWDYFATQPLGKLTNSISGEGARASQMYTELCNMLAGLVQVIVYMLLALLVSWYITAGAIIFGLVLFFGLNFLIRASRSAGLRETEIYQALNARLADGLGAMKPLKAMSREASLQPVLETQINDLNRAWHRQIVSKAALNSMQEPLIAVLLGIGMFVALTQAGIAFEKLIFMALLFHRIVTRLGNVHAFYQSVTNLESAYWALRRAIDHADAKREIWTGTRTPTLRHGITFSNVGFSYGSEVVLWDLSLTIPANRITTIAGPSGAGKTTVADLIVGLFKPDTGQILIDETPLDLLDISAWRRSIGYVPQEMILLHDSVETNIVLGESEPDPQRVEEVLRQAGAWDFVSRLPEGTSTVIGERGVRLSGGQRQRISLARALYRRPSLLILDEPTTALDPETEAGICRTLTDLKLNVTMLAISHQQALTAIADNVITLGPLPESAPSNKASSR